MRTAMKIRRGLVGAVDPEVALYPFLADHEWALATQFEHITIDGKQYPYRDAEATDPVVENGDPTGHVVGMQGTPSVVQEVSADRPVWGEDGVEFEAATLSTGTREDAKFLNDGSAWTVIIRQRWVANTTAHFLNTSTFEGVGVSCRSASNGRIRLDRYAEDGSASSCFSDEGAIPADEYSVLAYRIDGTTGSVFVNGVHLNDSTVGNISDEDPVRPIQIGRDHLGGMSAVMLTKAPLPNNTIAHISDLLS